MQSDKSMPPTLGPVHSQEQSPFFRLPLELRDTIYSHIFTRTRITHGKRDAWGKYEALQILPIERALSLLRTCRRMTSDIGKRWLGQVLFNFEDVKTMMEKLAPLPIETISAIRHLRVRGGSLMLHYRDEDVYYRLVHTLKLLSGLQLDVLTVLAVSSKGGFPHLSYDILNGLIYSSQGWKELRFISQDSEMLGFAHNRWFDDRYLRQPQPAHWAAVIESRDGVASQASVTIYRSTLPNVPGSVTNKETRALLQQQGPETGQEATYGQEEETALMTRNGPRSELMIVAKRGKGVHYQEKLGSPFLPNELGDIREDCPGMNWSEIKRKHIDYSFNICNEVGMGFEDPLDEESQDGFEEAVLHDGPMETDEYEHIDDYVWDSPHITVTF